MPEQMHARFFHRLVALFFILLLGAHPASAQNRPAPTPLFDTPGLAAEALKAIAERIGREPRVALVDIRGSEMTVHVQGARPHHLDKWTWIRGRGLIMGMTTQIRGPEIAQPLVATLDPTTVLFPLERLPLDELPALIDRISPRAMLEEPALPQSIRIERQLLLVGGTRVGEARIMVHWNTGRESSYVYLNMDGSIHTADVSGTFRARGLDMARDDWHLPMAAQDLAFFGTHRSILRVEIEPRDIDVSYMDPQSRSQTTGMRWTLNGLSVNAPVIEMPATMRPPTEDVFAFTDIDFAMLPALKAAALEKVNEPGMRVLKIVANRPITSIGTPQLVWTLTVGDPAKQGNWITRTEGEAWQVVASPAGEILRVILPPGRRPSVDWWTPANLRDVIDRLVSTFPVSHPFREIVLDPQGGRAHAVDGGDPTLWREFSITAHEISVSSIGGGRHDGVDGTWFTLDTLDGYSTEVIFDLVSRTFETMSLPDGYISRLTFSRGNTWVRPPEGQVMLEIRVEHGMRGGRLTWLADGTELDRVMP
ncbi:hypothetical protein ACN2CC_09445 [Mesorhizobium muleiense]|uniref:hypothetical protein n=1 Tax=Mesorhizobium muleiense TaxID=1004279 RepID=UPI003AFA32FA